MSSASGFCPIDEARMVEWIADIEKHRGETAVTPQDIHPPPLRVGPLDVSELMANRHVVAWCKAAEVYHPTVWDELRYAAILHFRGRADDRPHPIAAFLTTYVQLRDWARVQCAWLDGWLATHVICSRDELKQAVIPVPQLPVPIFEEEPVKQWFERVQVVDPRLCASMWFLVLRRHLGIRPTARLIKMLSPLFAMVVNDFECVSPPLQEYLEDSHMAVDIEPLTPSVPASEAGAQASRIRRPTKPNRAFVEVPPRNLRERGARWKVVSEYEHRQEVYRAHHSHYSRMYDVSWYCWSSRRHWLHPKKRQ